MQQMVSLLQILFDCSTCFGHHYARQSGAQEYYTGGCCLWYLVLWFFKFPVWCRAVGCVSGLRDAAAVLTTALHQTGNLKTKAPNTRGSNHLYNILELLMTGIMVPETC